MHAAYITINIIVKDKFLTSFSSSNSCLLPSSFLWGYLGWGRGGGIVELSPFKLFSNFSSDKLREKSFKRLGTIQEQ